MPGPYAAILDALWYALIAVAQLPNLSERLRRSIGGTLASLAQELERPNPLQRRDP
jgi:hypothetical protein